MKALVLAGGFPQIALIQELKSRGITVVLADWNEDPVAKSYADVYYQVSTLDMDAVEQVAKQENVDFLITVCTDQALHTVAYVSEKLGLPCYIDYETALNVTNKSYMKKVFTENNISTAKYVIMSELDENLIERMQYPLIVKPVDCNSSKGVKRVDNLEELRVAFQQAVNYSRTKTAVIEQFIVGTEISVDIYVEGGQAKILCVSKNEKIADKNKFVIFRGLCPASEAEPVLDKIEKTAQQIVDAFKLQDTPMLIQLITDGREVYVLEFSARTGGGTKYLRIKTLTGFDVIKAVVDLTLGKKPHFDNNDRKSLYLADEFIYCWNGKFHQLDGFEKLKKEDIIKDYYVFKKPGALLTGAESSGDRIAGFTITSKTFEGLKEKHNLVAKGIKVLDSNGIDIMRHDLLTIIN